MGSSAAGALQRYPNAARVLVRRINQTPGWFSCDTLVAFHCECACR